MSLNEKSTSKESLGKAGASSEPEVCLSHSDPLSFSNLLPSPQLFTQEVRHALATELDIADEKKADLLFQQAEQISDEEAEEIMREILEEHRHSTCQVFPSFTA